ncbi:hypothetical protein [Mesorhizobium sophorae]|uniref:hypothetical protein n=1 Tax=Mesorhizobium sophorae TaxID=1300294 RepID=UPI00117FEF86|nr:hypothetical protein [Mesorhizobium sophorae]
MNKGDGDGQSALTSHIRTEAREITGVLCRHSAVCLPELTHVFGRLDPANAMTKSVLKTVEDTIGDIPGRRAAVSQFTFAICQNAPESSNGNHCNKTAK